MKGRRTRIRKAAVVAAFTAFVALAAVLAVMSTTAQAANEKNPQPNLSGTWKLDPARSDDPRKMMGGPGHGGPPEAGRPGERGGGRGTGERGGGSERGGGPGGPPPDGKNGPPHGMVRLPDRIAIVQWPAGIEMRDSTGVVVQRVLMDAKGEVAPVDSAGVAQLSGEWKGQTLKARSNEPRGGTLTETYEIIDGGKALKITTHIQPPGDRPAFDVARVFARVSG
jgi:hypothetical protein